MNPIHKNNPIAQMSIFIDDHIKDLEVFYDFIINLKDDNFSLKVKLMYKINDLKKIKRIINGL